MRTIATIKTAALTDFDGDIVMVEADLKQGLPGIHIVGMGSKSVFEARERIRSALAHSLLSVPRQKCTINLAPAELPKDGAHFDLPLALSLLVASGQLRQSEVAEGLFAGELSLNGQLRPIRGALLMAEVARRHDIKAVYLPASQASQAALVSGVEVFGVTSLKELYLHLKRERPMTATAPASLKGVSEPSQVAFAEVAGQEPAKRALAIAIAGRHNILLTGPPGTGKTLLAQSAAALLPTVEPSEVIEITKMAGFTGIVDQGIVSTRPFRSPHHSTTTLALVGGGQRPQPGEISLAHRGILFLDEIAEFRKESLEALRQPLEDKHVTISRLGRTYRYPADILVIATMNPCPCGYFGDPDKECRCQSYAIERYQASLSGPIRDRIDMTVVVSRIAAATMSEHTFSSKSMNNKQHITLQKSIKVAISKQKNRYICSTEYNGNANKKSISAFPITNEARQLLKSAADRLRLSSRPYLSTLKVARTIADLDDSECIEVSHVSEALSYRLAPP